MRVTQKMIFNNSVSNINRQTEQLFKYQEQIASGKSINRPSDNPLGMARTLHYRNMLDSLDQYSRNIEQGDAWLNITESALSEAEQVILQVKEIAMAQSSETEPETKAIMAKKVEQLYDHLAKIANTKLGDRYVFSGLRTDTMPFTRDDDYNIAYQGDRGSINLEINQNYRMKINTTGQEAFLNGTNVFDVLKDLRNALLNNDPDMVAGQLDKLDFAFSQLSRERSKVGTRANELDSMKTTLTNFQLSIEELRSKNEDTDVVKAYTELTAQQTAFQAALQSTAIITNLSLMDYMK